MVEENKSSKGIGELFVEFGSKGLPKFFKDLNQVSASFLLGKNAANQFVQTITALPKEAGNSAVNIGKMSNALGTSYKEYIKLQMYLKSKNLSEGLLGDIANLNNTLYDFKGGLNGLPSGISTALERLGLGTNLYKYATGLNGILELLDDVDKRTQGHSKDFRNSIFRELGISSEFGYAFDRGDFNMRNAFSTISDKEVETLIRQQEALAKSGVTLENFKNYVMTKMAPLIEKIADKVTEFVDRVFKDRENIESKINNIKNNATKILKMPWESEEQYQKRVEAFEKYKNDLKESKTKGTSTGGAAAIQELKYVIENPLGEYPKQINKPPSYKELKADMIKNNPEYVKKLAQEELAAINASASNIMNNYNRNINVYNDVSISGINAEDAQRQFIGITQETIRDAELSQFQMGNMPGL